MGLRADYLELEMPELAEYLLREIGQTGDVPTNPAEIIEYLKLQFAIIDLAALLPAQAKPPRGVLSYADRIIGVDLSLQSNSHRARFTTLHEVGHYVLPNHQKALYLCNEQDLSFETMVEIENEASRFAAELLFKGDQFTREANEHRLTPEDIKTLALRYDTSFEAAARRFVERNARPCSLAVFGPALGGSVIDTARRRWVLKYTVSSPQFRTRYFQRLLGELPAGIAKKLVVTGRDFADAINDEIVIESTTGDRHRMHISYFTNHHCIFVLVQPKTSGSE